MQLSMKKGSRTEERELYVSVDGSDVGRDLGSKDNPFGDVQLALDVVAGKKGSDAEVTWRIGMGPGVPPGPYRIPGNRRVVFFGWDGR